VGQNGCVQAPQRFPGIDAVLTGQQVAGTPAGVQCLRLPTAAVQRKHELAVQPLPQWTFGGCSKSAVSLACRQAPGHVDAGFDGSEP
jgi:hypothetical protein